MEKKYLEGWQTFLELCLEMGELKNVASLFDLLLTAEEKESLAMRALIIRELLAQEKTQRAIARDLNVSIAKITRGSNELKRMKPEFLAFLKTKLVKE
jgi:TrpR family trp operon transcriptional repressor